MKSRGNISEDWLSVIIAFGIILLAILGIFGEKGLKIIF
jgi:hypothetical protein